MAQGLFDADVERRLRLLEASVVASAAAAAVSPVSLVILTDAAQTITTATSTPITWGTEVSDLYGWTSGGSATLTVPSGSVRRYTITYSGAWNLSTATAGCAIVINGTVAYVGNDNAQFNTISVTAVRTLFAGDTVSVSVIHGAGANRDIVSRLEIA